MSLRRPTAQLRLLQRLLAEGVPLRQVVNTAEQTEGSVQPQSEQTSLSNTRCPAIECKMHPRDLLTCDDGRNAAENGQMKLTKHLLSIRPPPWHVPPLCQERVQVPIPCISLSDIWLAGFAVAGPALQAVSACLRSVGGNTLLPAAAQHALRPRWSSQGGLTRVGSHGSWQYGGSAQSWAQPGSHAFHCFSAPQSAAHQREEESQPRRRGPSGGRRGRTLHTSACSCPPSQLFVLPFRRTSLFQGYQGGHTACFRAAQALPQPFSLQTFS